MTSLLLPVGVYVFYIWFLAIKNFRVRIGSVGNGEVRADYFKTYTGQEPSSKVIVTGRHYDNQFQLPMLFFVTCLSVQVFSLSQSNGSTSPSGFVACAWIFVLSRFVHSWIHLGSNRLRLRILAFTIGWLAILLMWVLLLVSQLV